MIYLRVCFFLWLTVVSPAILILNSSPALGQTSEKNTPPSAECVRLLEAKDYEGLERLVGELRKKAVPGDTDARRALSQFYKDLAEPAVADQATADKVLGIRFEELSDWAQSKPSSANHIALAEYRMDQAYRIRGTNFANATPEADLEAAHQAALEADRLLKVAEGLMKNEGVVDPALFKAWLRTGMLAQFEAPRMHDLVTSALDADPWYLNPVGIYAQYLRPRWFGEEGDLLEMADELSRRYATKTGETLYAYVAIDAYSQGEITEFSEDSFQWPRVRRGLDDWLKKVPDSLYVLAYKAKFAHLANDRSAAKEAFEQLGNRYNTHVFPEPSDYLRTYKWAEQSTEAAKGKELDGVVVELGLSPAMDLAFVDGGESVAVAIRGTSLPVYSVSDGSFRYWVDLQVAGCERIGSDPDGTVLYVASPRRTRTDVATIEMETGKKKPLMSLPGRVRDFAVPRVANRFFAANDRGDLQRWDIDKSSVGRWGSSDLGSALQAVAVAPDASRVVSAGGNKLAVWSQVTNQHERTIEVDIESVQALAWSPSNPDWVAVAGTGVVASIWSVSTGMRVSTFTGGAGDLSDLAFSPDGKRLVAGTMSVEDIAKPGDVLVWDVEKGELLRTLAGNRLRVRGVAVSPDGKKVLSAGDDGTLRIWPMP